MINWQSTIYFSLKKQKQNRKGLCNRVIDDTLWKFGVINDASRTRLNFYNYFFFSSKHQDFCMKSIQMEIVLNTFSMVGLKGKNEKLWVGFRWIHF